MSLPQPVPPAWKDLGKSSNDLLGKDFPIGYSSLEVKTSTPSNVVFKALGTKRDPHSKIHGLLEAKYTDRKNGLTFTQAWNVDNHLLTNVELDNQLVNGLKVDLATVLAPQAEGEKSTGGTQPKSAILSAVYKQPGLHTSARLNVFDPKGPVFSADTVIGHDGFLLGAEASYNVDKATVTKYAAAVGFSAPEYAVTLLASDSLSKYTASYYHRVSRDVEAGGRAHYDSTKQNQGVKLEVGTKAYLDSAAFIKAKIDHLGLLSLGYTQALRPGVKASFGLAIDTKKLSASTFDEPAHKVGASFVFEG